MTPACLSSVLRSVASRIDASKNPSRSAVAAELRRVLAAVGPTSAPMKPVLQFDVLSDSPLDLDTDGTLGVDFTNLLESVGDVEWDRNGVSITLHKGALPAHELFSEIKNGKHGDEMKKCVESLTNGHMTTVPALGPTPFKF